MVLSEAAWVGALALLLLDEEKGTFAVVQSALEDNDTLTGYRAAFAEAAQDQGGWMPWRGCLPVGDGDVLLMHAASPGNNVDEIPWRQSAHNFNAQVLRVPAGLYNVDLYRHPDSEDDEVLFTRFQRGGS